MVVVGRDHHVGGQGADEAEYAVCPRCRGKTAIINYPEEFDADEEVRQPFKEGVAAWEETGEGSAPAPPAVPLSRSPRAGDRDADSPGRTRRTAAEAARATAAAMPALGGRAHARWCPRSPAADLPVR
ncbi:hypothetical protein GCM10019016_103150 [Streptomyces prasinosporus]|uniref:Uncharacterized protein n=1 Tax=Streptomyces prasinosporus TaxID=68256 RepID=A0ABP6U7R4_9ACTN